MAKNKQKVPESGILRACLDLLAAEGIWHRRWNTGAVTNGARFYRFGQKGDADILAIFDMKIAFIRGISPVLWIECKSSNGTMSNEQCFFCDEIRRQSHEYLLVKNVDTLRQWLKKKRVLRGEVNAMGRRISQIDSPDGGKS